MSVRAVYDLLDIVSDVAVRVLWSDGNAEVLGSEHAAYLHRLVARHRPGP